MRLNHRRAGITGIVYDGVDLTETFQVVEVRTPLLPTIEAVAHELPQRPGSYFAARKVGTRSVVLKLRLEAASRNPLEVFQAWREVSSLVAKDEPKRLYLGEDRWCMAMLVGETEMDTSARYGTIECEFACFDPYFYGAEHSASLSAGTAKAIDVVGAVPALPTLALTASSTSVTVTNMTTGQYVLIPDLTSGAAVTVDMARQVSTAAGQYAPVDLLSDYFAVNDGDEVKVTGAYGTLSYTERWI